MTGTFATTAIITKGLTCANTTPCQSGIITTFFSLYCRDVETPPPKITGGGAYPYDAWNKVTPGEIQNFYQPVDVEQPYLIPRDQESRYFEKKKIVTLRVKIGDREIEHEYSVREKRANQVIKIINLINATGNQIKVNASNIRRRINDVVIKVKDLTLKR